MLCFLLIVRVECTNYRVHISVYHWMVYMEVLNLNTTINYTSWHTINHFTKLRRSVTLRPIWIILFAINNLFFFYCRNYGWTDFSQEQISFLIILFDILLLWILLIPIPTYLTRWACVNRFVGICVLPLFRCIRWSTVLY